jgi:DNA polymerase type B, organellar and viral
MNSFPMPIGKRRFFEGDILKVLKQPFGFFEVEITTPNNLKIPILLTRVTKNTAYASQTSTMAPLGN